MGKITSKNTRYGLQTNVNDETIQGFKQLDNVDVNYQLGSLKSRPGLVPSNLISPINYVENTYYNTDVVPNTGDENQVTLTQYWNPYDNTYNPMTVFTASFTGYIRTFDLTWQRVGTLTSSMMTLNFYEFDSSTGIRGAKVGFGNWTMNVQYLPIVKSTSIFEVINADATGPMFVEYGKEYIAAIEFSSTFAPGVIGSNTVIFYSSNNTDSYYGMAMNTQPTLSESFYTVPGGAWYSEVTYNPVVRTGSEEMIGIQCIGNNDIYVSGFRNDLAQTFKYGKLTHIDNNYVSNDVIVDTPSNQERPVQIYNFPGALYGLKVDGTVHKYIGQYAGSLKGRNDDGVHTQLMKVLSGDSTAIPVVRSLPCSITLGASSRLYTDTTGAKFILPGIYMYYVEFVDKDGYAYDGSQHTLRVDARLPDPRGGFVTSDPNNPTRSYIANINVNPDNSFGRDKWVAINLYRAKVEMLTVDGVQIETPGPAYFIADLIDQWHPDVNLYIHDDALQTPATSLMTDRSTYYIPAPMDFTLYKDKIIAAGDWQYPNYIFPSRDVACDFFAEDSFTVTFPDGDTHFTAVKVLNDECFVFSKFGTWGIRQVSTVAPFFSIRQVSSKYGSITTSKGIVQVGNVLYVITTDGVMQFDGNNFTPVDDKINRIFDAIDFNTKSITIGGTPTMQVDHIPSLMITGQYDITTKCIVWVFPSDSPSFGGKVYSLCLKTNEWSTISVNSNNQFAYPRFVYYNARDNKIGLSGSVESYDISLGEFIDYANNGTQYGITTVAESTDFDMGEKTRFDKFRLWGIGIITLEIYFDRETTPTCTFTNESLTEEGLDFPLGWNGNYFRYKITTSDSENFELKGMELVFTNTGLKKWNKVSQK